MAHGEIVAVYDLSLLNATFSIMVSFLTFVNTKFQGCMQSIFHYKIQIPVGHGGEHL